MSRLIRHTLVRHFNCLCYPINLISLHNTCAGGSVEQAAPPHIRATFQLPVLPNQAHLSAEQLLLPVQAAVAWQRLAGGPAGYLATHKKFSSCILRHAKHLCYQTKPTSLQNTGAGGSGMTASSNGASGLPLPSMSFSLAAAAS